MIASLASLGLGTLTLSPEFDPDVTAYTTSTTNASNMVSAVGADGSTVSITINGAAHVSGESAMWQQGDNLVKVIVKNGSAHRVYTVTVTKAEGGNG